MNKRLPQSQRKALKAKAHHLNPVILLGEKGLTDAVVKETEIALLTHELIKVKINKAEREERAIMSAELAKRCQAEIVQTVGRIVVLYKKNPEKH